MTYPDKADLWLCIYGWPYTMRKFSHEAGLIGYHWYWSPWGLVGNAAVALVIIVGVAWIFEWAAARSDAVTARKENKDRAA